MTCTLSLACILSWACDSHHDGSRHGGHRDDNRRHSNFSTGGDVAACDHHDGSRRDGSRRDVRTEMFSETIISAVIIFTKESPWI